MRVVISAYRADADAHTNAQATQRLLAQLHADPTLRTELVVGGYKGLREVSVAITSTKSWPVFVAAALATRLITDYRQAGAYLEHDGRGYLLAADGTVQDLGETLIRKAGWPPHKLHTDYTLYLDGSMAVCTGAV